jgi:hypothetical protein
MQRNLIERVHRADETSKHVFAYCSTPGYRTQPNLRLGSTCDPEWKSRTQQTGKMTIEEVLWLTKFSL